MVDKTFSITYLANAISGKIYGSDEYKSENGFTGIFETLNEAKEGDIVIRHRINGKGVEIANNKKIACLITLTPMENTFEMAEKLNFPVIVVSKIEIATAFALKWTIENLTPNSKRFVISGTNGKSTTSDLIYQILSNAGYNVFTNTDAKSEFNTLIDPMVAKLISEQVLSDSKNCKALNDLEYIADIPNKDVFDYLVIEVSEVQGWGNDLMENHAFLMADAISPNVGVVTNVAMDHIGLVNSIDEVFFETSGLVKAINKDAVVLNFDDKRVLEMEKFINLDVSSYFTSMNKVAIDSFDIDDSKKIYFDDDLKAIVYEGAAILNYAELPFTSEHFLRNILSAVSACIGLSISMNDIVEGVKNYKSLSRRFTKLNDFPLIIDDFAHNPEGIKATIKAASKLANELNKSNIYVICAIRGSRGKELNKLNSEALSEVISHLKKEGNSLNLILSSSVDVVDHLNYVEDFEKEVFLSNLDINSIDYIHYEKLWDALNDIYALANDDDLILLIGAQGMDPAEGLLKDIIK